MYVLFLDGGPLMVVQSYEEDDLKKKQKQKKKKKTNKQTNKNRPSFIKYCLSHSSYFNQPILFYKWPFIFKFSQALFWALVI